MSRQSDPFGHMPVNPKGQTNPCFECKADTKGTHHVIPVSLGGTKVIPLCEACHSKVHGGVINSGLIKEGLRKARENKIKLGAPVKLTEKIILNASKMRSDGLSYKEIAKALDVSVGAIHGALNKSSSVQ